ncbi:MAG: bifunctional phosphoribosyl-AMP cyclohydrolase/phosphoribosyl-ATP diphosphatase HisIE [Thermoplasmata archaeon]
MIEFEWNDEHKLIPAIAQDVKTNNVLMLAYMSEESLELTKKTGYMHYWSRSKNRLWKKGEESGNVQKVVSLNYDCDKDTILARVRQTGNACHLDRYSCFSENVFGDSLSVFLELWSVFEDRKKHHKEGSYVCKLLKDENLRMKKLGEELTEFVMAIKDKDRGKVVTEAADLMFHIFVVLFSEDVHINSVAEELGKRRE